MVLEDHVKVVRRVLGLLGWRLQGMVVIVVVTIAEIHAHHLESLFGNVWLFNFFFIIGSGEPVNSFHIIWRGDIWGRLHLLGAVLDHSVLKA